MEVKAVTLVLGLVMVMGGLVSGEDKYPIGNCKHNQTIWDITCEVIWTNFENGTSSIAGKLCTTDFLQAVNQSKLPSYCQEKNYTVAKTCLITELTESLVGGKLDKQAEATNKTMDGVALSYIQICQAIMPQRNISVELKSVNKKELVPTPTTSGPSSGTANTAASAALSIPEPSATPSTLQPSATPSTPKPSPTPSTPQPSATPSTPVTNTPVPTNKSSAELQNDTSSEPANISVSTPASTNETERPSSGVPNGSTIVSDAPKPTDNSTEPKDKGNGSIKTNTTIVSDDAPKPAGDSTEPQQKDESGNGSTVGIAVGVSILVIVLLVIVGGVVFYRYKKSRAMGFRTSRKGNREPCKANPE